MRGNLRVLSEAVNAYNQAMTIWRPALPRGERPVYRALADALEGAVDGGVLRPGSRLPPQRALARSLGVTVMTVTRAYREAARRGLIEATVGRGSFVRRAGATRADTAADLATNLVHGADLDRDEPALAAAAAAGVAASAFRPPSGSERQRSAGATWLARSGLSVRADQILVTVGAQHALFVTLAALTRPGDAVLAEELTYHGLRGIAQLLHVRLEPVGLDGDGLDPGDLDRVSRRTRARRCACVPTLPTPRGTVMALARPREVVEGARRRSLPLVEDAVYGFLLAAPPPPLAARAPERTVYMPGTSKSLSPALRVGYL